MSSLCHFLTLYKSHKPLGHPCPHMGYEAESMTTVISGYVNSLKFWTFDFS